MRPIISCFFGAISTCSLFATPHATIVGFSGFQKVELTREEFIGGTRTPIAVDGVLFKYEKTKVEVTLPVTNPTFAQIREFISKKHCIARNYPKTKQAELHDDKRASVGFVEGSSAVREQDFKGWEYLKNKEGLIGKVDRSDYLEHLILHFKVAGTDPSDKDIPNIHCK